MVFDPEAMDNVKGVVGRKVKYAKRMYEALEGADALMIMTEWPAFRTPDFDKIKSSLKNNVIFDGRNLYALDEMEEKGFTYYSIGRKAIKA